jgi:ParB family chromosome partitioning protein
MSSIREKLIDKKTKLVVPRERTVDHPAHLGGYQEGSLYNVPVELIQSNPEQPRKYFDEDALAELADSIQEKGVLQPVIVRREEDGTVVLVAGERRLRAARRAHLTTIPAILTAGNPAEISLIENLQRENLRPIEEAEAMARMVEEHGYTQERLAQVVGKARPTVTETLSLVRLPESIKEQCRRADIYPRRLLVEIAKQGTPARMIALFERVKKGDLKSDQLREITREKGEKGRRPRYALAVKHIRALDRQLRRLQWNSLGEVEQGELKGELHRLMATIHKSLADSSR